MLVFSWPNSRLRKFSLELWQEMLTDFIEEKSRVPTEQWVVMGNSIGGLVTLMLTESMQEGQKVRKKNGAAAFDGCSAFCWRLSVRGTYEARAKRSLWY